MDSSNVHIPEVIKHFKQQREEERALLLDNLRFITGKQKTVPEQVCDDIFWRFTNLNSVLAYGTRHERIAALNFDKYTSTMLMLLSMSCDLWSPKENLRLHQFNCLEDLAYYATNAFYGLNAECAHMLFVDNAMHLLSIGKIFSQNVTFVSIALNSVLIRKPNVERCGVFIIHNHPGGPCTPSSDDFSTISELRKSLVAYGIIVLDSIIVTDMTVHSMFSGQTITVVPQNEKKTKN